MRKRAKERLAGWKEGRGEGCEKEPEKLECTRRVYNIKYTHSVRCTHTVLVNSWKRISSTNHGSVCVTRMSKLKAQSLLDCVPHTQTHTHIKIWFETCQNLTTFLFSSSSMISWYWNKFSLVDAVLQLCAILQINCSFFSSEVELKWNCVCAVMVHKSFSWAKNKCTKCTNICALNVELDCVCFDNNGITAFKRSKCTSNSTISTIWCQCVCLCVRVCACVHTNELVSSVLIEIECGRVVCWRRHCHSTAAMYKWPTIFTRRQLFTSLATTLLHLLHNISHYDSLSGIFFTHTCHLDDAR